MDTRPKVVIVGAGFAGLYAAKALRKADVDILMVDQHNYHTFQPLLYQVAAAILDQGEIVHPVRAIFSKQKNFRFRQGTVIDIDLAAKRVRLAGDTELAYDYLIVAAGAIYNDFGIPGVRDHGYFLKSLSEAVNMRSHILRQFERVSADPALLEKGALNVVIVGGGPTGVEMAGTLVELFERVMPRDFPELDVSQAKVILVEMLESVLAPYSEASQAYTARVLRERGVELRMGEAVAEVRADEVELKSGSVIPSQTMIWAAGIRASPLVEALGVELTRGRRIKVREDLSLPEDSQVFVAGDMAGATDAQGDLYPQVAQVAIQQGRHAASQIMNDLKAQKRTTFRYFDKGIMAIIARNAGVAELSKALGGFRFKGLLGWLSWLFIHLIYLVGYQNRVKVFMNWLDSYLTFDRQARLITDMEPSPAELADKTGKLVPKDELAHDRDRFSAAD